MIIKESYSDIENYLRSPDLLNRIYEEFGKSYYNTVSSFDITTFIEELIKDMFNDPYINSEKVIVCKVVDSDISLIDTENYVINFNGYYYDFCAIKYNDSFDQSITELNIPVIQKIIYSDAQIADNLSSVKGYVLLGY